MTTGDFVLIAGEVNPVIRELEAHGIRATALHSHMLRESPRLFFLHFWGLGQPRAVAEGIGTALAKLNVKMMPLRPDFDPSLLKLQFGVGQTR